MRALFSRLLLLAIPLLAACGDSTGPGASIEGTYRLESVNASRLPYEFIGTEILSGSFTLSGGAYTGESTVRYEDFDSGQPTTEVQRESGTYTRTGNTIHLLSSEGEQTDATYDGSTLTINAGLIVAVYRRQ